MTKKVQNDLTELMAREGLTCDPPGLRLAGEIIGRAGPKGIPYSEDYIRAVLKGNLPPGQPLIKGIERVLSEDWPLIPVSVLVLDPKVDGALVAGDAIKCRCGRVFVRNSPRRKYCPICSPPRVQVKQKKVDPDGFVQTKLF